MTRSPGDGVRGARSSSVYRVHDCARLGREGVEWWGREMPRGTVSRCSLRIEEGLNVDGVVAAAEGDQGFAICGRPDGFAIHPVDELKVVAVVARPHEEKARGLVGAVAIAVHGERRKEEEVAAA